MKRKALLLVSLFLAVILALTHVSHAQLVAGPAITDTGSSQPASNHTFSFSGTIPGQLNGALSVTFSIYPDQQSASALWTETQVVQVTAEKYTVMLGSTSPTGLPPDIFSADQAHWLGVQVNGSEKRFLLVSVPYAMKAVEAERLGGLLPSDFVTVQQLQSALQNAVAAPGTPTPAKPTATGPTGQAALAGTPPQPATDFTDSNATEVLLVTQQGTGFAIHAITSSQAEAILAQNDSIGGTALHAFATNATGASIGVLAETASPNGIAGVFNNQTGGKILSLRNNGVEVAWADQSGGINANGMISANFFSGNGGGLFNIPNSATTATISNTPNTIVLRDSGGGISAAGVNANFFSGNGGGLFNIPNSATTATISNTPNTIVLRDSGGGISATGVNANFFSGNGGGLFNIPNSATTATISNTPNTIVLRDAGGGISTSFVNANFFSGNGGGLFNIPPSAVGATEANTPSAIVARDASGNFASNFITANGLNVGQLIAHGSTDFSSATSTIPVKAVLTINTPASCVASKELLVKTDAPAGQQLFICNAAGNGYVLVGDGTSAGVSTVAAGDGSVAIGGTGAQPTIAVASGGITADKLAPNAVTAVNIADGALSPTKITGTAATLGANTFSGSQTVLQNLTVNGVISNTLGFTTTNSVFAAGGNFTGTSNSELVTVRNNGTGAGMNVSSNSTVGILASGPNAGINSGSISGIGVKATSTNSYGIFAASTNAIGTHAEGGTIGLEAVSSTGIPLKTFTLSSNPSAVFDSNIATSGVKLVSGRRQGVETFFFDNAGNWSSQGGLTAAYPNNPVTGTFAQFLAKLDANGNAITASTSDTSGIIGIVASGSGTSGSAQVTFSGLASCNFDGPAQIGHYAGISFTQAGRCRDAGAAYPTTGQVIGQVVSMGVASQVYNVLVFSQAQRDANPGTLTTINTGAGLTGGPITSSGTISIANGGVSNAMLQNSSVFVTAGSGLSGGGAVPLGNSVTLSNAGVLSFNGRSGAVIAAPGDYSFAQIAGTAGASQLPATTVYNNQSNTFTADQTIQGNLATSGNINTSGSVTANAFTGPSANFTGAATSTNSVLAINDTGVSGSAISVNSANNPAALFISSGPTVFMAGKITGATTVLSSNGDLTLNGNAHASAFSGDGSSLTNVSAAKIGTLAQADIATNAALSAETTARQNADTAIQSSVAAETSARQSADTTLQTNINSESTARQAADTTLQNNINAETTARQTDVASVQASIGAESLARQSADTTLQNNISAETTARQSDTSTLQTNINNVSAADAKLAASNTFTTGTQDFSGAGATLPVRSVLAASTPTACIASKELLIKTDAPAGQQLFICNASGNGWNLVGDGASGGVTTFNGRNGSVSSSSGDYSFAQISGSAAASQLPVTVAYNNQSNTFTGNQTVNGAVTATSFSGSGSSLTGVNAATLSGIPSNAFAQLHTINTFTSEQAFAASTAVNPSLNIPAGVAPATPLAGDLWNNGGVLQYRDNASTTRSLVSTTQSGGLQLLKLTASITPTNIAVQSCTEQSFTVSGISTGDTLLSVSQPSTSSPGTNIAIGGFRVPAANTVAIQFCNVSRNNNSTPTSGAYTFALMR